jgi:hypothetical protein
MGEEEVLAPAFCSWVVVALQKERAAKKRGPLQRGKGFWEEEARTRCAKVEEKKT